jgi:CBS domain-containing protein
VLLREIMTPSVVTASPRTPVRQVAELMRDRNVGSVVLAEEGDRPVGIITDRDLAIGVLAGAGEPGDAAERCATCPVITGEEDMELEEAAALMVTHRIRRLPVVDADRLVGIVTLDDIAVRTGNLEVAKKMTAEVIEGALPQFYFHERG